MKKWYDMEEGKTYYIVAKTIKGKEFMYSKKYSILCKNENQAKKLSEFLNKNNDSAYDSFKLKDSEIWYVYSIDKYDSTPTFRLTNTKNGIKVCVNVL